MWPNSSRWNRILSATSCGLPTSSAPRGPHSASNCSRVIGDQPRSSPIRFIIAEYGGKNSSRARSGVSAT